MTKKTRDYAQKAEDFVRSHAKIICASAACAVIICLIAFIICVTGGGAKSGAEQNGVPLKRLYLPDEPGGLPKVGPSRSRKPQWDNEELEKWYVDPPREDLNALEQSYLNDIEALLNSAP